MRERGEQTEAGAGISRRSFDPSQTYSLHHLIEACGETGCPVCRCLIDKHDHRSRTPFTEREAASWSEALGFLAGQAEPFGNEVPRAAGEPHGKRG